MTCSQNSKVRSLWMVSDSSVFWKSVVGFVMGLYTSNEGSIMG